MPKKVFFLGCMLLCCFVAFSQSADVFSDIVSEEKASWQSFTYLVYNMNDSFNQNDEKALTPKETFAYFMQKGVVPKSVSGQSILSYADLSMFLFDVFDLPETSLLFRAFHTKRYAFRQMIHYGLFPNRILPSDTFNGSYLITIFGNFMYMFPDASAKTL